MQVEAEAVAKAAAEEAGQHAAVAAEMAVRRAAAAGGLGRRCEGRAAGRAIAPVVIASHSDTTPTRQSIGETSARRHDIIVHRFDGRVCKPRPRGHHRCDHHSDERIGVTNNIAPSYT